MLDATKGNDAILAARMGMSTPDFDEPAWENALSAAGCHACSRVNEKQSKINFPKREGEMYCIEPMHKTFPLLENASATLGLDSENFVLTNAAISSSNGWVKFPDAKAGTESLGIHKCV